MKQIYEEIQRWRREHFILYIYFYIALADNNISNVEWEVIHAKIQNHSDLPHYNEIFLDVAKCFQRCNDIQIIEVIDYFKEKFQPSEQEINAIFSDVRDIAEADDNFTAEEQEIELSIRHILK